MINLWVKESREVNEAFDINYINLSLSDTIDDINKFQIKKIFRVIGQYFQFLAKLLLNRFDLVYISLSPFGAQFYRESPFIIISKLFKKPVVTHLHAKGVKNYIGDSTFRLKLFNSILKDTYCLHLSESLFGDLPFKNSLRKIFALPNGIPENNVEKVSGGSQFRLLQVSNLITSKGGFETIRAVALIRELRSDIPIKLSLVGGIFDKSYYNQLMHFVKENDLEQTVEITDTKQGTKKDEYYSQADIFVFPTSYPKECFPLVILESFSHGLPVISTYEGAIHDIITDGKNGFLIEDGNDYEEIANRIITLHDNKELRQEMSQNALDEYKLKYRIEIFEQNFIKILQEILTDCRN